MSRPYFLLTPRDFNGKQSITIDELRQRRFMHRTIENLDDEVLNQENLAEGFFFANFLPLTFEKLRSSQKPNEGLKSYHDLLALWICKLTQGDEERELRGKVHN